MVPLLLEGPSGIIRILLSAAGADFLSALGLCLGSFHIQTLPLPLARLRNTPGRTLHPRPVSSTIFSFPRRDNGGVWNPWHVQVQDVCHLVGCRRDWLCFASNLLFMQGQEPIFVLQAASCSCMHSSQLFLHLQTPGMALLAPFFASSTSFLRMEI